MKMKSFAELADISLAAPDTSEVVAPAPAGAEEVALPAPAPSPVGVWVCGRCGRATEQAPDEARCTRAWITTFAEGGERDRCPGVMAPVLELWRNGQSYRSRAEREVAAAIIRSLRASDLDPWEHHNFRAHGVDWAWTPPKVNRDRWYGGRWQRGCLRRVWDRAERDRDSL